MGTYLDVRVRTRNVLSKNVPVFSLSHGLIANIVLARIEINTISHTVFHFRTPPGKSKKLVRLFHCGRISAILQPLHDKTSLTKTRRSRLRRDHNNPGPMQNLNADHRAGSGWPTTVILSFPILLISGNKSVQFPQKKKRLSKRSTIQSSHFTPPYFVR